MDQLHCAAEIRVDARDERAHRVGLDLEDAARGRERIADRTRQAIFLSRF
jgi:hypothetical protein